MREITIRLNREPSDYESAIDEALISVTECDECGAWLEESLTMTDQILLQELRDALRLL